MTLVRERLRSGTAIALALDADPQLGEIRADERKLQADHTQPAVQRGQVHARRRSRRGDARRDGRWTLEVAVSDTGIGIANEDQEAVFEEFRQVGRPRTPTSRKAPASGSRSAKRFVELHGGTHSARERAGQGLDLHVHPAEPAMTMVGNRPMISNTHRSSSCTSTRREEPASRRSSTAAGRSKDVDCKHASAAFYKQNCPGSVP